MSLSFFTLGIYWGRRIEIIMIADSKLKYVEKGACVCRLLQI